MVKSIKTNKGTPVKAVAPRVKKICSLQFSGVGWSAWAGDKRVTFARTRQQCETMAIKRGYEVENEVGA